MKVKNLFAVLVAFGTCAISFRIAQAQDTPEKLEMGPSLAEFGVQEGFFVNRSTVSFAQEGEAGDLSPLFDFGVSAQTVRDLINKCNVYAYRLKHDPNRSVKETANLLCADVNQQLKDVGIQNPTKFLVDWLRAEEVCAYTFSNVKFDGDGLNNREGAARDLQERPFLIFSMPSPVALCPGFSKIATELAYCAGLKCCTINGVCRWTDKKAVKNDNHSWVMFDFGNNIRVPADVTPMQPINPASLSITSKISWHCLPATARSWELFMRMHWPSTIRWTPEGEFSNGGVPTIADKGQHNPKLDIKLFDASWEEWASVNSKPYWDLYNWYFYWSYKKYP